MFAYIVRRMLATMPVMAVVALFVFALLHLSPGDPAAIIAGDTATLADIARIHHALGLDQPLYVQFGEWVWGLLHGDFGISIFTNLPVSTLITQRVEPTVTLTLSTLLVSVLARDPDGRARGMEGGTRGSTALVMIFAVIGFSVPGFVIAYVLIFPSRSRTDLLPVQGFVGLDRGLWPFVSHLVMPTLALGHGLHRTDRAHDPRQHARRLGAGLYPHRAGQGLGERQDSDRACAQERGGADRDDHRHRLRAVDLGGRRHRDGIRDSRASGRLTVDAILRRDYPIIQGIILIFSAGYVLVNLSIDLSYTFLDPRIRY